MDESNKLVLKGKYIQRRESRNESENMKELVKPFSCDFCGKTFWIKHEKATHLRVHTGEKPFECELCHKRFSQKGNLKTHLKVHVKRSLVKDKNLTSSSPKKQLCLTQKQKIVSNSAAGYLYPCTFSDTKFPGLKYLSVPTKEKSFQLSLSDKKFTQKGSLKTHLLIHSEKPFSCNVCQKRFTQKGNLHVHYYKIHAKDKQITNQSSVTEKNDFESLVEANLVVTGDKKRSICDKIEVKYVCTICGKSFNKNQSLNLHYRVHFTMIPRQLSSVNNNSNTIGKPATSKTALPHTSDPSMEIKIPETVVSVQDFNKSESTNNSFEKLPHHQDTPSCDDTIDYVIDTKDMSFICQRCGKRLSGRPSFLIHYRIHSGEKLYKCNACNKKFNQLQALKFHKQIHTGEKPFKCDFCYKTFRQKQNLLVHLRVHTGEKPYQCDVCHKTFRQQNGLKQHSRIHTGEKPYQCDVCDKAFALQNGLKQHSHIHTGEKPYQCDICDKTFALQNVLKQHYRIHTGEKSYQCDICNRTFRQQNGLKQHYRIHTGEKPYQCDICIKAFTQQNGLKRHSCIHNGEKVRDM